MNKKAIVYNEALFFILVVLLLLLSYLVPMVVIEGFTMRSFCRDNGFDILRHSKCINDNYITKEDVKCDWGFYKVTDCRFVKEKEVISMEEK
jgi:hypothetical protein